MKRFARFIYHPGLPLGRNGRRIIGCEAHRKLAKDIAIEGTVLLKNDGLLPLKAGTRICPFGGGIGNFLFGGGGSGSVISSGDISLSDSLREEADLQVFTPLLDFYRDNADLDLNTMALSLQLRLRRLSAPQQLPEDLYAQAKAFGGVALLCVSRYSTESSTFDRSGQEGDFLLWPEEQVLFDRLCADFEKVLVVLNVCGPVATGQFQANEKVGALLYPMFGGGMAGDAILDILMGRRYPSGHLTDTLADRIEDYPSTASFLESPDHVEYREDIFVGYRYFETMAPEKALYPFGFGLGYTTFDIRCLDAQFDGRWVRLSVSVKNTGSFPGKEVAQVYLTAPQGRLGKAKKVLTAFQKTKELQPGQEAILSLRFDLRDFGSFDDTGLIQESAFVLEAGAYTVSLGANVRDSVPCLRFSLDADLICKQCRSYMAPKDLPCRLRSDGSYEALPQPPVHSHPAPEYRCAAEPFEGDLAKALEEDALDGLLSSLTNSQLGQLLYGHPMPHPGGTGGIGAPIRQSSRIPLAPTADGPAGYRAQKGSGVYTTFFPCANVLAQTWEPAFARRMGKAGALELKESNGGIWLAPALNIHRNPMCGRNFEYYSEDPLISGLFAAAFVQGVQSQKIAATVKHFCCNGKEENRKDSDSRVSQRALREIYLRGFEIAVKKSNPWCLMTAYNLVNGCRSSANWEAIQGILKGEWGYKGLVMTDWQAHSTIEEDIRAGSHVKMPEACPGNAKEFIEDYDFEAAIAKGQLTRENLLSAAKQVLLLLDHFE